MRCTSFPNGDESRSDFVGRLYCQWAVHKQLPTIFGRGRYDSINVAHALMVDREKAEGDENTWYGHPIILLMN